MKKPKRSFLIEDDELDTSKGIDIGADDEDDEIIDLDDIIEIPAQAQDEDEELDSDVEILDAETGLVFKEISPNLKPRAGEVEEEDPLKGFDFGDEFSKPGSKADGDILSQDLADDLLKGFDFGDEPSKPGSKADRDILSQDLADDLLKGFDFGDKPPKPASKANEDILSQDLADDLLKEFSFNEPSLPQDDKKQEKAPAAEESENLPKELSFLEEKQESSDVKADEEDNLLDVDLDDDFLKELTMLESQQAPAGHMEDKPDLPGLSEEDLLKQFSASPEARLSEQTAPAPTAMKEDIQSAAKKPAAPTEEAKAASAPDLLNTTSESLASPSDATLNRAKEAAAAISVEEVVKSAPVLRDEPAIPSHVSIDEFVSRIESRLLDMIRETVEARLPDVVRSILREEIEKLKADSR